LVFCRQNSICLVVTDRDNAPMNVVAKVLPETTVLLCYFHIRKNVRVKCITDCRVKLKLKDVKVYGNEVKEVKASDVVNKIMRVWDNVVESPTKDSYASVVMRFRDVCKIFAKFLDHVETTILNTVKEKFVRVWTDNVFI